MNQLIITYPKGKLALIENHAERESLIDPSELVILSVQCISVAKTLPSLFAFDHSAMIKLKSFVDVYFGDEA